MRILPPATLLILAATAVTSAPAGAAPVRELDLTSIGRTAPQGETGAEIATFDRRSERAFVTNSADDALDIYDLSDPADPTLVRQVSLAQFGGGPTSVDVSDRRGGIVAVSVQAVEKTDPGTVQFFDTDGDRLGSVPTGALPDMVTFNNDDRTLLVANEGEPNADYSIDPEGSVTVVDLQLGVERARVRTATFDGVPLAGPVRIFGPGASVKQDLEPEYIAVDPEDETAYVTLQENNAIGILDIESARFEVVKALGFKDHSLARNGLDASDRDGAINIRPWDNLFGVYMPDAIAAYENLGRTRLVTANEGDAREYDNFVEEARVKDLELDPAAFPAGTQDDAALGRLNVTQTLGDANGDGLYEELYAFGGRSMSTLDANADLISDTGDALERFNAKVEPDLFNPDHTPSDGGMFAFDDRSDNKGPEPEGVTTGEVLRRPYAFLSNERQGGIFALDMSERDGRAQIAGYINTRPQDLGPEGLHFIDDNASPTGEPLLLSTNEITGTLSIIEVRRAR